MFFANQSLWVGHWYRDDSTQKYTHNSSRPKFAVSIFGGERNRPPALSRVPRSRTAIYFNHSSKFLFAKYLPSHSPFIACAMSGYTPCPGIPIYVGISVPEIAQQRFKCFSRIIYLFISCFPLECSSSSFCFYSQHRTHTHTHTFVSVWVRNCRMKIVHVRFTCSLVEYAAAAHHCLLCICNTTTTGTATTVTQCEKHNSHRFSYANPCES